jgi:hypothetical protein
MNQCRGRRVRPRASCRPLTDMQWHPRRGDTRVLRSSGHPPRLARGLRHRPTPRRHPEYAAEPAYVRAAWVIPGYIGTDGLATGLRGPPGRAVEVSEDRLVALLGALLLTYFFLALTSTIALIAGLPKRFPQTVLMLVGASGHMNDHRTNGPRRLGATVALGVFTVIAVVLESSVYRGLVGPWNSEPGPDSFVRAVFAIHLFLALGWTAYVALLYLQHGKNPRPVSDNSPIEH